MKGMPAKRKPENPSIYRAFWGWTELRCVVGTEAHIRARLKRFRPPTYGDTLMVYRASDTEYMHPLRDVRPFIPGPGPRVKRPQSA